MISRFQIQELHQDFQPIKFSLNLLNTPTFHFFSFSENIKCWYIIIFWSYNELSIMMVKFSTIIPGIKDIEQHKILEMRGHKGSTRINENFRRRQNSSHWRNINVQSISHERRLCQVKSDLLPSAFLSIKSVSISRVSHRDRFVAMYGG